jgi:hypothetical protein
MEARQRAIARRSRRLPARTARERVVQANGGEQSRPPVPAVVGPLAVGAAETVTGIAVDEGRSLVRRRGSTPRSSSSTRRPRRRSSAGAGYRAHEFC